MLKYPDWRRQDKHFYIEDNYNRMPNSEENQEIKQLGEKFTKLAF